MAANADDNKVFRVNNRLCHFSRNGAYLAVAFQTNLLIKDAKTLDTCQSFVFGDVIQVSPHGQEKLNFYYYWCAMFVLLSLLHYSTWSGLQIANIFFARI